MAAVQILTSLAYRNVWRNKRRSLITLFAVCIGVWSCVTLSSIARGLSWGMADETIKTLTGHLQILAPGYREDPSIDHSFLMSSVPTEVFSDPAIKAWTSRIRVPSVIMSERESLGVTLVGIDPKEEEVQSFLGGAISQGKLLRDENDPSIVVGERLLELLQTSIGKRIVLMSQNAYGELSEQGFRITGVFDAKLQSTEQSYVFIGRAVAQELLKVQDGVSEISILVNDREEIPAVIARLSPSFPNLHVVSWQDLSPFVSALLRLQSEFIGFLFLLVFAAVSFGVINTLLMAIFERTREIGLLKAIGMKKGEIVFQVVLESLFLVCLGSIIGNLFGYMTVSFLQGTGVDISAFAEGAEHFGASRIIYPVFVQHDWIQVNYIVLLMGILSSVYPALKAAGLKPVEALRSVAA